ncbi:hypothetical protein CC86DRAFT_309756 [Ophiobolus disseminans]|uniref:Uncharacterized protein n=1 Tax=Ophiobolus disseminans TaxID=1469910 RepID=A0A6A6ZBD4_9PLEO|nr:hypothetical protein CC86DRAFT_309756 [Ophiobolus disseminans]
MTKTIEIAFGLSQLRSGASTSDWKQIIIQKARELLPRYMDPVPLNFAIYNYDSLMKTSYEAGTRIKSADVAIQALIDAQESVACGLGSKVNIVIVEGAHTSTFTPASTHVPQCTNKCLTMKETRRVKSSRICFASLPGSGPSDICYKLSRCSNISKGFCNCVELPGDLGRSTIKGTLLRKVLAGIAD